MIRQTKFTVEVVVQYDDETTTEATAQARFMEGSRRANGVHFVEITKGLVNSRGVKLN